MPKFFYQAKNAAGQTVQGSIESPNETEAKIRLRAQNLNPIKVAQAVSSQRPAPGGTGFFSQKVSAKDLQIFTRQFSTLINAGIPVVDSLKILSEGKRSDMIKMSAQSVRLSLEGGKRLGDSLAMHPAVFDRFYVNMVRAGEEAGILDTILTRLASYIEKTEKIKGQVKSALAYPAIILSVSLLVITLILVFIIPRFQTLYASGGKELPLLTQIVVDLSHLVITKWYVFAAIAVAVPWALRNYYQTPDGKDFFDRILIQSPVFGELIQKSSVAKFSRTLSTLLSSGVGVVEALEISSKTAGNRVIESALMRSKEFVTQGKPIAAPLAKEKMIPDMVVQMISIGEQSGTLDTMLSKVADFYEDDVENAVKALTSVIEPILMIVLGGIIAVLVTAMYLPIFNISSVVGGG